MIPDKLIVLYSKYSSQCNDIIRLYNSNYNKHIQLVCIDNIQIREQILHSTHLNVKTVPCVLFVYPDKRIEKFEGSNVKQWIIQQIMDGLPASQTQIIPDNQSISKEATNAPVSKSTRSEPTTDMSSEPGRQSAPTMNKISDKSETEHNDPITPIETIMYTNEKQSERQNVSSMVENSINKKKSISDLAADIAAGRKSFETEMNLDSFERR